jgi:hypothetical protein
MLLPSGKKFRIFKFFEREVLEEMFQPSTLADDRLPARSHTPCYLSTQKAGEGFHPLPFGLSLIFSNLAEKNQRLDRIVESHIKRLIYFYLNLHLPLGIIIYRIFNLKTVVLSSL